MSGYRLTQTALYRDTALLRPPYTGIPPYSDRLISGYRLTQTALYRDTALLRPPCWGTPAVAAIVPVILKYLLLRRTVFIVSRPGRPGGLVVTLEYY